MKAKTKGKSRPVPTPMPTENDARAVQLTKVLFDAMVRVRANTPPEQQYSISGVVKVAERMGERELADWIKRHPTRYGEGFWHGFYVDDNYPG